MANQTLSTRNNIGVVNIVVPGVSAGLVPSTGLTSASLPAATTSTAGTINYYDSGTFGATFTQTGGYSQAVTVNYIRVGSVVSLRIPHSGTATATAGMSSQAGAVLTSLRPATTIQVVAPIRNGGQSAGAFEITSAGTINLFTDLNGAGFTSGNSAGLTGGDDFVLSYPIV